MEPRRPRRQQGPARRGHALYRALRCRRQALPWLPLVQGQGPLTPENGFHTQADVVLRNPHGRRPAAPPRWHAPEGFVPHRKPAASISHDRDEDRLPAGEGDAANRSTSPIPVRPTPTGTSSRSPRRAPLMRRITRRPNYTWDASSSAAIRPTLPRMRSATPKPRPMAGSPIPDNMSVDPAGRLWVTTDGPPDAASTTHSTPPTPKATARLCPSCSTCAGRLGGLLAGLHSGWQDHVPLHPAPGRTASLRRRGLHLDRRCRTNWPDFIDGHGPRPSLA